MASDFWTGLLAATPIILSVIVTISTVIYTIFSWKMIRQTNEIIEQNSRPSVVISANIEGKFFTLRLENRGNSAAKNLDFKVAGGSNLAVIGHAGSLSALSLFQVSELAVGQSVNETLGLPVQMAVDNEREIEPLTIEFGYTDLKGKQYKDSYSFNFEAFRRHYLEGDPLREISESLKQIARKL